MMCEGTLLDMIPNFATGSVELKLKISGCEILEHTKEWKDKKLRVNITKQRAKRSLDANGYYWALLSQVAGCMGISKEEAHNKMICEYGQPETQEDGTVVRFAMLSDIDISRRDDIYGKPIGSTFTNGKRYTEYIMMRGSSTYNTAEMAKLITGLVDTIHECDIPVETLTPVELERIMQHD